jgi:hypothetical protein
MAAPTADPPSLTGFAATLHRAALLLRRRLEELELRVRSGDEEAWVELREVAVALVALEGELRGALPASLTTAEMAAKVGVSVRSLLRRKRRGEIKPAFQAGRLIKWRGDEAGGRP